MASSKDSPKRKSSLQLNPNTNKKLSTEAENTQSRPEMALRYSVFNGSLPNAMEAILLPFLNLKGQIIALSVLIFLVYANTLPNGYCVDDGMVLAGNRFTKEGFKGIKDILTKDSFIGGMDKNVLPGGRYRPLSLVTFAVEWQFFGENPMISHLLNIVFYILTCVLLLQLLRKYLFRKDPLLAFIATLVFALHPIHIECVTNIKGRDEILAMLFMFASLLYFFRYLDERYTTQDKITLQPVQTASGNTYLLALALGSYFLALLSKENPVTFLFILPVTLYFFTQLSIKDCAKTVIPFLIVTGIYVLVRIGAAGLNTKTLVLDVFQDPYILATTVQKYATIILVLGYYLRFLFYPHPSSFDYTYNQIPYEDFSNIWVIVSVLVHVGMVVYALWGLKSKKLSSYLILFYLASISIVSNIVFNLGGVMGERFLFQPSIAFAIGIGAVLAGLYYKLAATNLQTAKYTTIGVLAVLSTLASTKIMSRNADWKDNGVLYTTDVNTVPNSTRANKCAGEIYLRRSLSHKDDTLAKHKDLLLAIKYLERSIQILPSFKEGLLDLGSAYCFVGRFKDAEKSWAACDKYHPDNGLTKFYRENVLASEYGTRGYKLFAANKVFESEPYFLEAVKLNTAYHVGWYHLGHVEGARSNFKAAVQNFEKAIEHQKENSDYYYHYGGALFMSAEYEKAIKAFESCKKLTPAYPRVDEGLKASKERLNLQK